MASPDLGLSVIDLKNGSSFAKNNSALKKIINGQDGFGYQSFEDNDDDRFRGGFEPVAGFPQHRASVTENLGGEPRQRKLVGFGDKDGFNWNRGSANGVHGVNDDEVEECQIRTYGGPVSKQDFRAELRTLCSLQTLKKRIPISKWLPRYTWAAFSGDIVAGLTVGMTAVPQSLAYAQIADLPLEYGLYSAFMGPFIYAFLGTSKDVTVGPTALLSLLTAAFIPHKSVASPAAYAVLLAFYCGCFQLLMGILHLGFLMNFVSTPVMSGFTTAASIIIILGQLKGILGISFGRSRDNIVWIIRGYIRHIGETNGWDVLLGACCIGGILMLKSLAPLLRWDVFRSKQSPLGWKILREVVKILCYGRYAFIVIIATAVAAGVTRTSPGALTITRDVQAGLPPAMAPDFTPDNKTFMEVVDGFGAGMVLVPIIGLFESVVVAKAFSHRFGYTVDSTQEFIAVGICNIVGSFFGSFSVTGAFSRSALNAESGVRTPLGGLFTGALVLIAMSALSPVLHYIPKAALSAVIISAIFVMLDFRIFRDVWHVNRLELIPLTATLLMCLLLGVEYGLPLGIGISILMLVYPLARPLVTVEYRRTYRREKDPDAQKVKPKFNVSVIPHSALYFPSAEFFKDIFAKDLLNTEAFRYGVSVAPDFLYESAKDLDAPSDLRGEVGEKLPPIVFNGIHLLTTDYSTVRTLRNIIASCKMSRRDIVFINTTNEFMKLLHRVEGEVQMEQLRTANDRTVYDVADQKVTIDSEGASISSVVAVSPSYESTHVEFPGKNIAPSDLNSTA